MQPQKATSDKIPYSQLFTVCQEQGLGIDQNELRHGLGKIILSDEIIYTIEDVDEAQGRYRLLPIARAQGERINQVRREDFQRIRTARGNTLEYIALNTHRFLLLDGTYWENWNPLNRDDHKEIYGKILDTLQTSIQRGSSILVIGCGNGNFLSILTEEGYEAQGIDANKKNVEQAIAQGNNVQLKTIEEIDDGHQVDVILDPGVLSAGVVERSYVKHVLPKIATKIKPNGYFIHAPFSRSLLTSEDLKNSGFEVCNMTIPQNLLTYELPKQFYIGKKNL